MKSVKFKNDTRVYALLFLLSLLKFLVYGFRYFPVLDDFIQYEGYRLYGDLSYVYFGIGTIATRPLASLLDPLFWGAMPKTLAFLLITFMHFASCVFFYKTAEKLDILLTPIFGIVYLLLPLNSESVIWLSASTRIVCGLFFSSIGLYFLADFIKTRKRLKILGFWFFTLISGGFYEAALAFSAASSFLLMLFFYKKIRDKWVFVIPFANGITLCGIYAALSGVGVMGSRASGFNLKNLFLAEKFSEFFSQLAETLAAGIFPLTKNAFVLGAETLLSGKFFPAFVLALMLLCSICFLAAGKGKSGKTMGVLVFAAVMFFAPLSVNFMAEEMWITFRSLGFSVFALALILDRLISLIKSRAAISLIAFVLSFIFCVGMAGEYSVYKNVSETDEFLCKKIYDCLDEDVKSGKKEAVVILKKYPESTQTFFYKDHVKSVTQSDWSLTGGVRAAGDNIKVKKVTPVLSGEKLIAENTENKQIIYMDENFNVKGEK